MHTQTDTLPPRWDRTEQTLQVWKKETTRITLQLQQQWNVLSHNCIHIHTYVWMCICKHYSKIPQLQQQNYVFVVSAAIVVLLVLHSIATNATTTTRCHTFIAPIYEWMNMSHVRFDTNTDIQTVYNNAQTEFKFAHS